MMGVFLRNAGKWLVAGLSVGAAASAIAANAQDEAPRQRALVRPVATCGCPTMPPRQVTASLDETDPEEATVIVVARVCNALAALRKTAATDDLEAAIVFAISQSGAADPIVGRAIAQMSGCDYGYGNFAAALQRVRDALLRKRLVRGTAVTASGGGSVFSTPTLNLGGGTSNYTR